MRFLLLFAATGLLALAAGAADDAKPAASHDTKLGAGDPAPAFSLPGSDGKTHSLSEYAGKKVVVVAWFPKVFTGG